MNEWLSQRGDGPTAEAEVPRDLLELSPVDIEGLEELDRIARSTS